MSEIGLDVRLSRAYGPQVFGSGGASGGVRTCGNCRTFGRHASAFIYGPAGVEVIDPALPARFIARGADFLGGGDDPVRRWSEAGEWTPGEGWRAALVPGSPDERDAWMRETGA